MMSELKPCPFCGSAADWTAGMGWFAVECTSCHVETDAYTEAEAAAEVWSRRAPSGVPAVGGMRTEFLAWVKSQGCDTDGAWSAWQGCWNLLRTPGMRACGNCGGTGKRQGDPCARCNGTGKDKHDPWCVGGEQDGICNCGADGMEGGERG